MDKGKGWKRLIWGGLLCAAHVALGAPGLYVVELEGRPAVERAVEEARQAGRGREARAGRGWAKHAAAVRAGQQQAWRGAGERGARVLGSVSLAANALIVEMEDAEAEALLEVAGVRRVRPVREYRMTMDAALPLHKIREAWELAGGESRAGEGVKIAILDSGVETWHPAFQADGMEAPEGFPRAGSPLDDSNVSAKVIVARSYVDYLRYWDPDRSARDHVGHGTALAMIAAGVPHEGPMGWVSGVAPKAWVGIYRVFGTPGYNDTTTEAALLMAIDDALADGMDILNLSLGSDIPSRVEDDLLAQAVENAAAAGAIVVVSAGNSGPGWMTIASPATAPSALSVGATTNSRTFGSSVAFEGHDAVLALPGNGPVPETTVSGEVADVQTLDGTGLACAELPAGSLAGRIALLLRGECTFQVKLTNAQAAGAAGAMVQAREESPDPITMAVGGAGLPAMMVSFADGQAVREWLAAGETLVATLNFSYGRVPQKAGRLASFSAHGPNVELGIKPELTATGTDMWVATQTLDWNGDMWDGSGYTLVDGTSFSAPLVAGAAAVVKAARPGLDAAAVRSALVNTAAAVSDEASAWIQKSGAGVLDLEAAVRTRLVSSVPALNFGAGAPGEAVEGRTFTVKQAGEEADTYFVRVEPRRGQTAPVAGVQMVELAPGEEAEIRLEWPETPWEAGTLEGFVVFEGAASGTVLRVPYWRAVSEGEPAGFTVYDATTMARRGSLLRDALLFRVVDANGLPARGDVTAEALDGGFVSGVTDYDSYSPGLYGLTVRLGFFAGAQRFVVRAGGVEYTLTVTAF